MTTPFLHLQRVIPTILLLAMFAGSAFGQIPATMAFQGLLTDENGIPLPTGDYSISFRIYDVETSGTALWTEVQSVSVVDGVGNATLGRINPLDLSFDDQYWLGITIGQNPTELAPRIQMNASAYAQSARNVGEGSVIEASLVDGAVTTGKISDGAVTNAKISTDGASAGQTLVFNDGAVAWGAPSGEGVITEIEAEGGLEGGGTTGTVSLGIANGGVTRNMIADGAISEDQLANNAVGTSQIQNDAVTSSKIPEEGIPLNRLSLNGAVADEVLTYTGTNVQWRPFDLGNGSITTALLADEAVTLGKISKTGASADEVLTFNGNAFTWASVPGAGAGSIGTNQLENGAVTTQKLADDAASAAKIQNGAVTTAKLDGDAVSTAKIQDGAVTGAKLANGSVDTQQLANDAVNSNKLASGAVMLDNVNVSEGSASQVLTIQDNAAVWADAGISVGPGDIGETELADGAVTAAKIQTAAVTTGKLNNAAVTNQKLADGAVTDAKIAPASIDPLQRLDLTGASNGEFLVFNGGAISWTNTIPGDLDITGELTKGSGSFKIDHPLDPTNKFLYHSFVESDEMMNVYSGNVELDDDGRAVVSLPEWFEAANKDFRYQLTCIGGYAPVYIEQEIDDGAFVVAGGSPNLRVSWQITAVRDDPFARTNRMEVEVQKLDEEKGTYLHPDAYE